MRAGRVAAGALAAALWAPALAAERKGTPAVEPLSRLTVAGPAAAAPADVVVRAWPSRTAVWVGDRVTYTIELRFGSKVEILADDLSRDKLRPEGLEVVGYETARQVGPEGGVVQTFRFELVSFEVPREGLVLRIGGAPVRYYAKTAGRRPGDTAPSGEVLVPPLVLGSRSTIPEGLESYAVRDLRQPPDFPRRLALAGPVGWSLILVSIVPVVVWGAALARRTRRPRASARLKAQRSESLMRAQLDALKRIDPASESARREVYDRLDALLRSYVGDSFGVPAASLTPSEVETALNGRGSDGQARTIGAVMAECELARYSRPALLPGAEQLARAVRETEKLLSRPGR